MTIFITSSAAPPCAGPANVASAVTMAPCRLASVPTVTRAAKLEALEPCSACRMKSTSANRAASAEGLSPFSIHSQLAACDRVESAATGERSLRSASWAAMIVGSWLVRRIPFSIKAVSPTSRLFGSSAARAEVAVRSTSIGWPNLVAPIIS